MTGTGWATLPTSSSVCIIFFILAWKEIEKTDRTKYLIFSIKLHVFSSFLTQLLHTRHKTLNSIIQCISFIYQWLQNAYGTILVRRRQIFHDFWPLPPYHSAIFLRQSVGKFVQFLTPPLKNCRRLKWMVPTIFQQNMHGVEFSKEYRAIKLKYIFDHEPKIDLNLFHIFWEGHKILRNLQLTFVLCSTS